MDIEKLMNELALKLETISVLNYDRRVCLVLIVLELICGLVARDINLLMMTLFFLNGCAATVLMGCLTFTLQKTKIEMSRLLDKILGIS